MVYLLFIYVSCFAYLKTWFLSFLCTCLIPSTLDSRVYWLLVVEVLISYIECFFFSVLCFFVCETGLNVNECC